MTTPHLENYNMVEQYLPKQSSAEPKFSFIKVL